MKLMKTLSLAVLLAASSLAGAQAPSPKAAAVVVTNGQVKAVNALLQAMKAEKLMRTVAARSRYANPAQEKAVFAKLDMTPPAEIYARLAYPLAKVISVETATEMTRFYNTPEGQQVVHAMYNSTASLDMSNGGPVVSPAERKALKNPAFVKARKALDAADPDIQSEAFKLLQVISKK